MMCVTGNVKERGFWKETRPLWLLGGQEETSKIPVLLYSNRENNPGHRGVVSMALRAFPSALCAASKALCMLLSPWALRPLLEHQWQNASEGLVVGTCFTRARNKPSTGGGSRLFLPVPLFALAGKGTVFAPKLCSFLMSSLTAPWHSQRSICKTWELGNIWEMHCSKIHYKSAVHLTAHEEPPLDFQNMTVLPLIFIPRQKKNQTELLLCISFLHGNHIKWWHVGYV